MEQNLKQNDFLDALIIGGGPAGLTGATYLARFRRSVLVLDAGDSRAAWVPVSHNMAGFPDGIGGPEILRRMKKQAETFGARVERGTVDTVEQVPGGFRLTATGGVHHARTLLLAMGVSDVKPPLPDLAEAVRDGLIRYCPVCDAFEAIDKRIVVLGHGSGGFGEANFLTGYSRDITVLTMGDPYDKDDILYRMLVAKGVVIEERPLANLSARGQTGAVDLYFAGGQTVSYDIAYAAIGCKPHNALAVALGVKLGTDHRLVVDDHMETSVANCFGAGDIVHGLNQISVGVGQAAIAAVTMHNKLRDEHDRMLLARA